jgi:chemotaxis protein MotD
MVLQRQVPARPAARAGEGSTGADAAGGNRNDAFSTALSQEKRSAAAEPHEKRNAVAETDKTGTGEDADAGVETGEPDDQLASGSGQSDDVLNLLSGLMSSAAYSDDAKLGKAGQDGQVPAEVAADAEEMAAVADTAEEAPAVKPDAAVVIKPAKAATDDADGASANAAAAKAAQAEAGGMATNAPQSTPEAQKAAAAQASAVQPGQHASAQARSSTVAPAALVSAAAAALTGQGTQTPAKASATESGSDPQKDQTAIKEVMRALGMEGEARPADDARIRGRNTGRQNETAERRGDEPAAAKAGKVEVIESRRFMPAQAMSANAQLLTRSLVDAGNTALSAQRAAPAQPLAQTGPQQAGQTLHTLKLQLNPVSLGTVTAVLKLSGDDLSVEIKVQTAEAYRQIKQDNESIIKALRGQGFGVEQITVQHVAGTDRASSQTPQQGFQPGQQGPGSSDAQSSGRESGRNNASPQGSGSQGGQGHEQSSYAGSGAGRTDGVYL